MSKKLKSIEERIQNIQDIYGKLDKLCEFIPEKYVGEIKNAVLDNDELKKIIDNLNNYRAPRILLIGRTGFGKSSIINALFGKYVAEVSDVESCTLGTTRYTRSVDGGAPIEILDTRGIAESVPLDEAKTAEKQILDDVMEFDPDVALLVLSCTSRDGMDRDIDFIKKVRKACYQKNAVELPVVVAINKADGVAPSKETLPYSPEKMKNIDHIRQNITNMFFKAEVKVNGILPVSSCIDWKTAKGVELPTADQINALSAEERSALTISFDGRYQIDQLMELLEESISNVKANMGIKLAFHLNTVLEKISARFVHIFCGIAAIVTSVSLPVADYVMLVALEAMMVAIIMALSGRDMSMESAKEFIASLTGTATAGVALREVARMAVKFIPGGGALISAGIATAGVKMIGQSAIDYYIKDMKLEDVRKNFRKNSKKEKVRYKGTSFLGKMAGIAKKRKSNAICEVK